MSNVRPVTEHVTRMENALLYTFSTIAQTLGGVAALLVAFALYRAQSLDAASQKMTFELRQRHLQDGELIRSEAEEQYDAFLARYRTLDPDFALIGHENVARFHRLSALSTAADRLRSTLTSSLAAIGLVVSLSVGLLVATPWLKECRLLAISVLATGTLGFVYCLFKSFKLGTEVVAGIRRA